MLYMITSVILSVVIVSVSCSQTLNFKTAIEVPFEEPVDEDAKDTSDDFADDKEFSHQHSLLSDKIYSLSHSGAYLANHINQVKEISTPPPKF